MCAVRSKNKKWCRSSDKTEAQPSPEATAQMPKGNVEHGARWWLEVRLALW